MQGLDTICQKDESMHRRSDQELVGVITPARTYKLTLGDFTATYMVKRRMASPLVDGVCLWRRSPMYGSLTSSTNFQCALLYGPRRASCSHQSTSQ